MTQTVPVNEPTAGGQTMSLASSTIFDSHAAENILPRFDEFIDSSSLDFSWFATQDFGLDDWILREE